MLVKGGGGGSHAKLLGSFVLNCFTSVCCLRIRHHSFIILTRNNCRYDHFEAGLCDLFESDVEVREHQYNPPDAGADQDNLVQDDCPRCGKVSCMLSWIPNNVGGRSPIDPMSFSCSARQQKAIGCAASYVCTSSASCAGRRVTECGTLTSMAARRRQVPHTT